MYVNVLYECMKIMISVTVICLLLFGINACVPV